jgi:hypothetical protein
MPLLATTRIDEAGAAMIRRWIQQLKNDDESGKGGANGKH